MTTLHLSRAVTVSETGDPAAVVQRTFERCGQAFCRYFAVRTRGDAHLVDDLMQQLWLRARLGADELRQANPEPWLWRIAQNLLREHRRRHANRTAGGFPRHRPGRQPDHPRHRRGQVGPNAA
jgi:DNA-directed RNA polymerase specialized sigma24 family protein